MQKSFLLPGNNEHEQGAGIKVSIIMAYRVFIVLKSA